MKLQKESVTVDSRFKENIWANFTIFHGKTSLNPFPLADAFQHISSLWYFNNIDKRKMLHFGLFLLKNDVSVWHQSCKYLLTATFIYELKNLYIWCFFVLMEDKKEKYHQHPNVKSGWSGMNLGKWFEVQITEQAHLQGICG